MSNLVLFRRPGEAVYLDGPFGRITVTVYGLRDEGVRLGFDAPTSVHISRPEHHTPKEGETPMTTNQTPAAISPDAAGTRGPDVDPGSARPGPAVVTSDRTRTPDDFQAGALAAFGALRTVVDAMDGAHPAGISLDPTWYGGPAAVTLQLHPLRGAGLRDAAELADRLGLDEHTTDRNSLAIHHRWTGTINGCRVTVVWLAS